jgi:hypothetical protein
MKAVRGAKVRCVRDRSSLSDCSLSFQTSRGHFLATKFTSVASVSC